MGVGRNHVASAVLDRKLYVIGGRPGPDAGNVHVVERYNPATGRWRRLAPLNTATSGAAAGVADGRVVVFGGEKLDGSDETIPATEAYDPATDAWTNLTDMLTPRHGLGGASLGHRVFAIEGGPTAGFDFSNVIEYLDVP
jgi:N-acetylneuraminic acid mutarotase